MLRLLACQSVAGDENVLVRAGSWQSRRGRQPETSTRSRRVQGQTALLSTLVRNVPVLNSLEMSPSEREKENDLPVEARGKLFCSFPRSGGRALFASTAPAASTGSSRL